MGRGVFITFEGGEGAGKTTQIALLAEHLRAAGYDILVTREPGGCPEGEALRELLLHRPQLHWSAMAQALIVSAARRSHIDAVIDPALDAGKTVLCDRFFDSTIAYQGYGLGADTVALRAIHAAALDGRMPDLTLLLDIETAKGLARARKRGAADTMEARDIDFHERLRQGYLAIAQEEPKRVAVINADRAPEDVHVDIVHILAERAGIQL